MRAPGALLAALAVTADELLEVAVDRDLDAATQARAAMYVYLLCHGSGFSFRWGGAPTTCALHFTVHQVVEVQRGACGAMVEHVTSRMIASTQFYVVTLV